MTRIPVVDALEASEWDRLARERHGIPSRVLMESAGRGCATVIAMRFPDELSEGVIVATGTGNNGGDGWVLARSLKAAGVRVAVVTAGEPKTPDCIANRILALGSGIAEFESFSAAPRSGLLVDSLLGTGASGPLRGGVARIAEAIVLSGMPVVAIDGPTGLDLTSGAREGNIHAAMTLTFGGLRRGHLVNRDTCGDIVVLDIGFPPPEYGWPLFVDDVWARSALPGFGADMHKGDRGRILIVGGNSGLSGAALHAVSASFAAGAGLVRLVTSADTAAAARATMPDVMTTVSTLSGTPEPALIESLQWADAVVLGPGLGISEGTGEFVADLVSAFAGPMILDADALKGDLSVLRGTGDRIVVTPHPGEFRRMLPGIELERGSIFKAARDACQTLGSAVLLKGVPTVVTGRDESFVVASGNPSLATGGSGDVLAGIIGAFLARGLTPVTAAALGAQVLGRAAEIASVSKSVRATRPADVLASIPLYWRELETPGPGPIPPVLLELPSPALA